MDRGYSEKNVPVSLTPSMGVTGLLVEHAMAIWSLFSMRGLQLWYLKKNTAALGLGFVPMDISLVDILSISGLGFGLHT